MFTSAIDPPDSAQTHQILTDNTSFEDDRICTFPIYLYFTVLVRRFMFQKTRKQLQHGIAYWDHTRTAVMYCYGRS